MNELNRTKFRAISSILPVNVIRALYALGVKYDRLGVELVLFGSFATGTARFTSDLDIGIKWRDKRSGTLYVQLLKDIDQLPTIRNVELVDLDETGEQFKQEAVQKSLKLTELLPEVMSNEA